MGNTAGWGGGEEWDNGTGSCERCLMLFFFSIWQHFCGTDNQVTTPPYFARILRTPQRETFITRDVHH